VHALSNIRVKTEHLLLDVIHVHFSVFSEFESTLFVFAAECLGLVDLCALRQLAVSFEIPRFVRSIFDNHICFLVLEISQRKQYNITLVDPDLLAHFASYVSYPLLAIETLGFNTAVSQHLRDLGVLLAVFPEHQLSLVVVVLVLSSSAILASLSFILRHTESCG